MKRRLFISLISLVPSIGVSLPHDKYTSSLVLTQYINLYTESVGKEILNQHNHVNDLQALSSQILIWLKISNITCTNRLDQMISNDLKLSNFYEIDNWVITKTEALISALIVNSVQINGN